MKKAYVATVQVLIPVDSEAAACDYVSESLRNVFPDWAYARIGAQRLTPSETYVRPPTKYEEGEFLA